MGGVGVWGMGWYAGQKGAINQLSEKQLMHGMLMLRVPIIPRDIHIDMWGVMVERVRREM